MSYSISMNNRKLLLAYIRKGDHAHAGENEAIELALKEIPKRAPQHLLDVGCGLGGTASYVHKQGWGKVSGIDIDREMISYAKIHYPQIYFHQGDVVNLPKVFTNLTFDVIYSFNAFFSFPDQETSLKAMAAVATNDAKLVIFDYSSPGIFKLDNPFYDRYTQSNSGKFFFPINMHEIEKQLQRTGWELNKMIDLSPKFDTWYRWLIAEMEKQKTDLIRLFTEETYLDLYNGYRHLLDQMHQNAIGGIVIQAIHKHENS